jgi:hypothetical protein
MVIRSTQLKVHRSLAAVILSIAVTTLVIQTTCGQGFSRGAAEGLCSGILGTDNSCAAVPMDHVTLATHPVNTTPQMGYSIGQAFWSARYDTIFYVSKTYHSVGALLEPTASLTVGGQRPIITVGIAGQADGTAGYQQKTPVQTMALSSPEGVGLLPLAAFGGTSTVAVLLIADTGNHVVRAFSTSASASYKDSFDIAGNETDAVNIADGMYPHSRTSRPHQMAVAHRQFPPRMYWIEDGAPCVRRGKFIVPVHGDVTEPQHIDPNHADVKSLISVDSIGACLASDPVADGWNDGVTPARFDSPCSLALTNDYNTLFVGECGSLGRLRRVTNLAYSNGISQIYVTTAYTSNGFTPTYLSLHPRYAMDSVETLLFISDAVSRTVYRFSPSQVSSEPCGLQMVVDFVQQGLPGDLLPSYPLAHPDGRLIVFTTQVAGNPGTMIDPVLVFAHAYGPPNNSAGVPAHLRANFVPCFDKATAIEAYETLTAPTILKHRLAAAGSYPNHGSPTALFTLPNGTTAFTASMGGALATVLSEPFSAASWSDGDLLDFGPYAGILSGTSYSPGAADSSLPSTSSFRSLHSVQALSGLWFRGAQSKGQAMLFTDTGNNCFRLLHEQTGVRSPMKCDDGYARWQNSIVGDPLSQYIIPDGEEPVAAANLFRPTGMAVYPDATGIVHVYTLGTNTRCVIRSELSMRRANPLQADFQNNIFADYQSQVAGVCGEATLNTSADGTAGTTAKFLDLTAIAITTDGNALFLADVFVRDGASGIYMVTYLAAERTRFSARSLDGTDTWVTAIYDGKLGSRIVSSLWVHPKHNSLSDLQLFIVDTYHNAIRLLTFRALRSRFGNVSNAHVRQPCLLSETYVAAVNAPTAFLFSPGTTYTALVAVAPTDDPQVRGFARLAYPASAVAKSEFYSTSPEVQRNNGTYASSYGPMRNTNFNATQSLAVLYFPIARAVIIVYSSAHLWRLSPTTVGDVGLSDLPTLWGSEVSDFAPATWSAAVAFDLPSFLGRTDTLTLQQMAMPMLMVAHNATGCVQLVAPYAVSLPLFRDGAPMIQDAITNLTGLCGARSDPVTPYVEGLHSAAAFHRITHMAVTDVAPVHVSACMYGPRTHRDAPVVLAADESAGCLMRLTVVIDEGVFAAALEFLLGDCLTVATNRGGIVDGLGAAARLGRVGALSITGDGRKAIILDQAGPVLRFVDYPFDRDRAWIYTSPAGTFSNSYYLSGGADITGALFHPAADGAHNTRILLLAGTQHRVLYITITPTLDGATNVTLLLPDPTAVSDPKSIYPLPSGVVITSTSRDADNGVYVVPSKENPLRAELWPTGTMGMDEFINFDTVAGYPFAPYAEDIRILPQIHRRYAKDFGQYVPIGPYEKPTDSRSLGNRTGKAEYDPIHDTLFVPVPDHAAIAVFRNFQTTLRDMVARSKKEDVELSTLSMPYPVWIGQYGGAPALTNNGGNGDITRLGLAEPSGVALFHGVTFALAVAFVRPRHRGYPQSRPSVPRSHALRLLQPVGRVPHSDAPGRWSTSFLQHRPLGDESVKSDAHRGHSVANETVR